MWVLDKVLSAGKRILPIIDIKNLIETNEDKIKLILKMEILNLKI